MQNIQKTSIIPLNIPVGQSYQTITDNWNGFSSLYQSMQAGPLTFYYTLYTLVNMMKLNQAENILQIGCGTGKLIPLVLDLKGVNNDRIICNCVLMHTKDPRKMLRNLYDSASDGCLLGLAVWGQKKDNPFFSSMEQLSTQYKFISQDSRSKFFLCDTIDTLVKQEGWQIILAWQQNSMIPVLEHSQNKSHPFLKQQISQQIPKQYYKSYSSVINELMNDKKCGLSFGCRLIIAKKSINTQ